MSGDEVICLSSESSLDEDESASPKSSKDAIKEEKDAQKRKLSNASYNGSPKKQKLEKERCSSPQPGCSKDFCKIENKKKIIKPQLVVKTKISIPNADEDVFQNFIKTCLKKRDDQETKQVLRKMEKLYNKLSLLDKNSDEFRLCVNRCHEKITKGLSNDIYTPILDLHMEIKNRIQINLANQTTSHTGDIVEEIEVSKANMKKIKQLEKSIHLCLKKIKELEEKEVDFDEDNDSVYIQEDKYKKRLIQLCNMLSKVSGDKIIKKQIFKRKIRRKDIPDEITGISSVDEAILSFVNSDIGKINQLKHLETQRCADFIKMPEYLDILQCIQKCNKDSNLDLSKEKMTRLAKRAFQTVGNFLKKRRMDETKFYIQSLSDGNEDPAIKDVRLNQKLQKNKKEGDKKLEEIFKKYVEKQEGLREEDVEKQAEASSDDDYSEACSKNEDLDTNLASDQESNQINDRHEKLESNSVKKSLIDEDKHKTETENQNYMKIITSENKRNDKDNVSLIRFDESFVNKSNEKDNSDKKAIFQAQMADGISENTIVTLKNKNEKKENTSIDNSHESINKKNNGNDSGNSNNKKYDNQRQLEDESANLGSSRENKNSKDKEDKPYKKLIKILEDNVVRTTAFKSSNVENKMANEKRANFEKTAQVTVQGDNDVLVMNDNDDLDDVLQVEDPLNINQVPAARNEAESSEILQIDIESSQPIFQADDSSKAKKSFIKVRAFAKPPPAWGDTSPKKAQKKFKLPVQQALRGLSMPECIDLTKEKDKRLPSLSARSINPLANINRTLPAKRVVIVKNVINNYNNDKRPHMK